MITLTCPSRGTLILSSFLSLISCSIAAPVAAAQGERDLRAERLVLDDDNGHTLILQTPQPPSGPMSGNYVVTIPEPSAAAATVLLSYPLPGGSGQSVEGSITIGDTLRAGDLEASRLSAPVSGSLRVQSAGSVTVGQPASTSGGTVGIDEDNNGTGSSFTVEANGASLPDLFRVTETGLTDVNSASSTGALRVTNTNAVGTAKILELLDGSASRFTVRRNGAATLGGDLTVEGTGTSGFAGSVSIGDVLTLAQESRTSLAAGATLAADASHQLVAGGSGPVTLSGTTAIANGAAAGQLLLLVGSSDANGVTIGHGANVLLSGGAASRTLGLNDTMLLLWNGADWIELSWAEH